MLNKKTRAALESAKKKPAADALVYDGTKGELEAGQYLRLLHKSTEIDDDLEMLRNFLVPLLQGFHANGCEARGGYLPTVLIETKDGTLQVVFQHRYNKISAEKEAELKKELGDDFGRYFAESVTLAVRKDLTKDSKQFNAVITELTTALGDRFGEIFESDRSLAPTLAFTEERKLDAATRARLGIKQSVTIQEKKAA